MLILWRAVHIASSITTLESQLGLKRPHRREQPLARSYRRVFGRQLGRSSEPKYVVSMSVNPRLTALVTLDQLRQRHLVPVGNVSRDYASKLMAWQPTSTPFTFPLLTVSSVRNMLNNTPHTPASRDLMEYVLLGRMSDDDLQQLLTFYNVVL